MTYYHVSFDNPLTFYLQIQLVVAVPADAAALLALQLSAWRPGRYELQNFAQKIQRVEASDADTDAPLPCYKTTKDRWEVPGAAGRAVRVRYRFYAHQLDAGGSWLDETQLYLNPVQALLYAVGHETEACQLTLALPAGWRVACGLPQSEPNVLPAASFDQLADSPLIASPALQHEQYAAGGVAFHVWAQGDEAVLDWPRLLVDFEAFSKAQLDLFGSFPGDGGGPGSATSPEFHFLNQFVSGAYYHGVEHAASTVIVLGPASQLMQESLYKELLGVSCHELFHVWNVKAIRPAEMRPYDYARENYFSTCYVAEGLTTYYGEYLLCRARIRTPAQYLDELNTVLRRHFADAGGDNLSLADASTDLWLDGYRPGVPDRKVSVYHKGALVALLLDLTIRQLHQHQRSLDDVLRQLYQEFGQPSQAQQPGYTAADYARVVTEVAGRDMKRYFDQFIHGTAPLVEPLSRALVGVGCELVALENPAEAERAFGLRVTAKADRTSVAYCWPGSPAEAVLSVDDEILAVNGRRETPNPLLLFAENLPAYELTVLRQGRLRTVTLRAEPGRLFGAVYEVQRRAAATAEQQAGFEKWLG